MSRRLGWALRLAAACLVVGASAQTPEESLSLPIIADTFVNAQPAAAREVSAGGLQLLRAANSSSFVLMRFDAAALSGLEITSATLRLHRAQDLLVRAGLSTISAGEWNEGQGQAGGPQRGAASYNWAVAALEPREARPWAYPGSDFSDVSFGQGGSRWAVVAPRFDKKTFWYEIDVPTDLVQAIAQRLQSPCLALADDFGRTEIACLFSSRESANKPELLLRARRTAPGSSAPPTDLSARRDQLGREWLRFTAPEALGFDVLLAAAQQASAAGGDDARFRLPAWALPAPNSPLDPTPREILLSPHRRPQHRFVGVRVQQRLAEWSELRWVELPPVVTRLAEITAPVLERYALPRPITAPLVVDDTNAVSENGRWIRSNEKSWWDPQRGPVQLQAAQNEFVAFQVILAGASGEYTVELSDWVSPGSPAPAPVPSYFLQHYHQIPVGVNKYAPDALAPLPPGAPITCRFTSPATQPAQSQPADTQPAIAPPAKASADDAAVATTAPADADEAGAEFLPADPRVESGPPRHVGVQGVWIDLYVPHQAAPGLWRARVRVRCDGALVLDVPLELQLLPLKLGDALTFDVSLLAQAQPAAQRSATGEARRAALRKGSTSAEAAPSPPERANDPNTTPLATSAPPADWDWLDPCQRLAHAHRVTLCVWADHPDIDRLDGFAPTVERNAGEFRLNWERFDQRWGRYLDGAAFRDLPREGVPPAHFRLPLCETWPLREYLLRADATQPLSAKYSLRPTYNDVRFVSRTNPPADSYLRWPPADALGEAPGRESATALAAITAHFAERGWTRTRLHLMATPAPLGVWEAAPWLLDAPIIMDDVWALRAWLDVWAGAARSLGERAGPSAPQTRARLILPQLARGLLAGRADILTVGRELFEKNLLLLGSSPAAALWHIPEENSPELGFSSLIKRGWSARLAGATGLVMPESLARSDDWNKARERALLYPPTASRTDSNTLAPPVMGYAPSLRLKALRRVQQDAELINAWVARQVSAGATEGQALATVGAILAQRSAARPTERATLLPTVELPARLDATALEELRRGLRSALAKE